MAIWNKKKIVENCFSALDNTRQHNVPCKYAQKYTVGQHSRTHTDRVQMVSVAASEKSSQNVSRSSLNFFFRFTQTCRVGVSDSEKLALTNFAYTRAHMKGRR